jgi:hypothetical protein
VLTLALAAMAVTAAVMGMIVVMIMVVMMVIVVMMLVHNKSSLFGVFSIIQVLPPCVKTFLFPEITPGRACENTRKQV